MNYRLMLVEDEPPAMRGIVRAIQKCPAAEDIDIACQAFSGAQALEMIEKSAPHLVLSDVRMPVMDGLEAARAIRAMRKADAKTVPIFAMTANAFQEDIAQSMEAGMNAHLAKPIEPRLLYETLKRYFEKADTRREDAGHGA